MDDTIVANRKKSRRLTYSGRVISDCLLAPLLIVVVSLFTAAEAQSPLFEPRRGMLLVASPDLDDGNFSRTVVLLLKAGDDGALGLVLNRPASVRLGEAFARLDESAVGDQRMFVGGPVQRRNVSVLVHIAGAPAATAMIVPGIHLGTTQAVLEEGLKRRWTAEQWRVFVGYAGWGSGQLQSEISRGDWRLMKTDPGLIFSLPATALWASLWGRVQGHWAQFRKRPAGGPSADASGSVIAQFACEMPWSNNDASECRSPISIANSTPTPVSECKQSTMFPEGPVLLWMRANSTGTSPIGSV
ncbi:MAG: YqgE/AlgH family protein [Chromatiales bacterium]|nr:YqgE/AlgH family protein [Chromatiales bacterium]